MEDRAMIELKERRLDRAEILKRAGSLIPAFRERAAHCEALRRVPDNSVADLIDTKLLRVCQPARFGGGELGWDILCEMSIEMARGDGSQAWVANVYAEHPYLVAMFEDRAQHEVWDDNADMLISASLLPVGGRVEKVDGGYRLTGKWPFASGVHHAGWAIVGEAGEAADGQRDHLLFLIPRADFAIDDDWFTVGMSGTGSASVVLDATFVPSHRTIRARDILAGTTPGARINKAPLYRMPLMGFAQTALAAVPIGTALGMVDDFKSFIRAKSKALPPVLGLELLQARFAESAAELHAASMLLVEASRRNMDKLANGGALTDADAALTMRDSGYALLLAKRASARVFEATGAHGTYLSTPIQRGFRDVEVAGNHGSLAWDRSAMRYAQSALRD
jgi:3-hydroxy-9,10-secoandrosta-1,3,5(10)-triene-9,17-dione monooxygenase